ncbi:uncharacterized protein LOC129305110 [Prosopis cineraria]|uniref:uncharacterized protein LOC129297452 n=1 Tax=Prosopis cineraria TaxID=364024 RepID=UPI00240ECD88|nr:uncharacterized protein LOC129297452 [Prosopis cineraria]XP_054801013.1 uncharacterized protein LOC129305110 [Prosopis cineraria]XP_054801014.1 uncharacterized protein LOC129305110 [Prosopis cineraria]XP_054801015.1 uncharacterized protein LOC129305110 [Prosopis cineraria]
MVSSASVNMSNKNESPSIDMNSVLELIKTQLQQFCLELDHRFHKEDKDEPETSSSKEKKHKIPSDNEEYEEPPSPKGKKSLKRGVNLSNQKVKYPSFKSSNNPEKYLDWEMKIDQIFMTLDLSELRKVKTTSLNFTDYTIYWWQDLQYKRSQLAKKPIKTWEKLKRYLRKVYVPSYYYTELNRKLRMFSQGSMIVEEYVHELNILKFCANIQENECEAMSRIMDGLRLELRDKLDLYTFVDKEELIHKAIKLEQRNKNKRSKSSWKDSKTTSKWKDS